jgi:Family of unknown function (DUF5678)
MSNTPKVIPYLIPEGIKKYSGRWVAIRHGKVVADAKSLRALRKDDRARPDDLIHQVPEPGIIIY